MSKHIIDCTEFQLKKYSGLWVTFDSEQIEGDIGVCGIEGFFNARLQGNENKIEVLWDSLRYVVSTVQAWVLQAKIYKKYGFAGCGTELDVTSVFHSLWWIKLY